MEVMEVMEDVEEVEEVDEVEEVEERRALFGVFSLLAKRWHRVRRRTPLFLGWAFFVFCVRRRTVGRLFKPMLVRRG